MLQSITITNFRCFGAFRADGFARFNLIGGLNNSGKTVLLEALALAGAPGFDTLTRIWNLRNLPMREVRFRPKLAWANFTHKNASFPMVLETSCTEGPERRITFTQPTSALDFSGDDLPSGHEAETVEKSTMHIEIATGDALKHRTLTVTENGFEEKPRNGESTSVELIPAFLHRNSASLAESFDEVFLAGKGEEVLKVLRLIDPSIEEIRSMQVGSPKLHLKKKDHPYLPLSHFGAAMGKIVDILVTLLKGDVTVLLLDEFENGLHHSCHRVVWRALAEIARETDVQIFATSHSREMIDAFADVFQNAPDAVYLEMARHAPSGLRLLLKHPPATLRYELDRTQEIRGE